MTFESQVVGGDFGLNKTIIVLIIRNRLKCDFKGWLLYEMPKIEFYNIHCQIQIYLLIVIRIVDNIIIYYNIKRTTI